MRDGAIDFASRDDDVLLPCSLACGVFQSARTSTELRSNMQFGIRHNRQSAGDHSDHVTRHTNNEAWVR